VQKKFWVMLLQPPFMALTSGEATIAVFQCRHSIMYVCTYIISPKKPCTDYNMTFVLNSHDKCHGRELKFPSCSVLNALTCCPMARSAGRRSPFVAHPIPNEMSARLSDGHLSSNHVLLAKPKAQVSSFDQSLITIWSIDQLQAARFGHLESHTARN